MNDITLDTLYSSVAELGALLKARKITSLALTAAYLDRLEKLGPKLNAVVTVMRDSALKEAKQADAAIAAGRYIGPLHGVPYGAKDLLATKGAPTTWGAEPLRKQTFDYDATAIRKLRDAGAVLIAKLAMVELAGSFGYASADASFTGPCKTPWNTDYWSGGSSSGSGAAVAAGLVGFALGSETSGSIITPASFCGVSGLRPTYGRVSRHGAMALSYTLDKLGPMARSAEDCGLVLAALAGRDPLDRSTAARAFRYPEEKPKRKYRIGIVAGATRNVQPAVKKNFDEAVKVLGAFAEVEDGVKLPDLPYGAVVSLVLRAEGACSFRGLIESGAITRLRSPGMITGAYAASVLPAEDYLQAMRLRGLMKRRLDEALAKYDAVVAPGRGAVANTAKGPFGRPDAKTGGPVIGQVITSGNVAGLPALCVPCGLGERGLPTAIQFTGRAWGEGRLLAIARAYQQATQWHKKRPPEGD